MKCFVTGATGFLGTTLVQALVSDGHDVIALVRNVEKAGKLLDSTVKVVVGDMTNVRGFSSHLEGMDTIYHTAAYFKEYTGGNNKDEDILQAINVDGVIELLNSAKEAGVSTVVHVSSSGVTAPIKGGNESTETFTTTANRYFQSKIRCEKEIEQWLAKNPKSVRVVIIRPVAMIGPGDNGPTGLGQTIIEVLQGKLPAIAPGALNFVDIRDVAQAMIAAGAKGASGEKYLVSAEFKTMAELFESIGTASDVKTPTMKLSIPVAMMFARMQELVSKLFRTRPQVTRIMMKTLLENEPFDGSKTEKQLGIEYRAFDDSINDEIAWFKENGYW